MKTPRIEISGIVLKPSGSGWSVGEVQYRERRVETAVCPRPIDAGPEPCPIEALKDPLYYSHVGSALSAFLVRAGRAEREGKSSRYDRELWLKLYSIAIAAKALLEPAQTIRRLRASRKLSLRALGKRAGVARATIREIESKGRTPLVSTLARIIRSLI